MQSHSVDFLSAFFMLGRGCRQGDPISTYLFVLCAEILAAKIRSNKNIKGIKINNTEIKLSQYADDTSAYLDGSQTSLEETLNELDIFDKTQVVWIGSKNIAHTQLKPNGNYHGVQISLNY